MWQAPGRCFSSRRLAGSVRIAGRLVSIPGDGLGLGITWGSRTSGLGVRGPEQGVRGSAFGRGIAGVVLHRALAGDAEEIVASDREAPHGAWPLVAA